MISVQHFKDSPHHYRCIHGETIRLLIFRDIMTCMRYQYNCVLKIGKLRLVVEGHAVDTVVTEWLLGPLHPFSASMAHEPATCCCTSESDDTDELRSLPLLQQIHVELLALDFRLT